MTEAEEMALRLEQVWDAKGAALVRKLQAENEALRVSNDKLVQEVGESIADKAALFVIYEQRCAELDAAMTRLIECRSSVNPDVKNQSFAKNHPRNPLAKCQCEHWEACIDCHPTFIKSALKGEPHERS
jgi:hypothetical protein